MAHYLGHIDNKVFAENWKNGTTNMQQENTGQSAAGASFMGPQPNISGMYSPQYTEQQRVLNESPAQWQLDFNKNFDKNNINSMYNPPQQPYNSGGGPGSKVRGQAYKKKITGGGQNTPWSWGGPGGKAETGLYGLQTLGGLYMSNEARKLGAADLDFKQNSFNNQYASQRALVNDQMFSNEALRNREAGMSRQEAEDAADIYVNKRGVQERMA